MEGCYWGGGGKRRGCIGVEAVKGGAVLGETINGGVVLGWCTLYQELLIG